MIFVAGKGGTGKSTVSAALALIAAARGRRVLCIEADGKSDLAGLLGSHASGFQPRTVRHNISVMSLIVEEAMREYVHVFFRVPAITRLGPLARVIDFVATGVPGAKDMLVVGKIAFEEKKRDRAGAPVWDLIIVDSSATGHVLPQLRAARSMMKLVKGGIIKSQTEWIDATIADPRRTVLTICTLPEEMPVTEALELYSRARAETRIHVGVCWLNRTFPVGVGRRDAELARAMADPSRAPRLQRRLGGGLEALAAGTELARTLCETSTRHLRRLRAAMSIPVVEIPLRTQVNPGLATARAVAAAIEQAAG